MQEQEKAEISKNFIEALLQVPVVLCKAGVQEAEEGLRPFFPEFLVRQFPFFLTKAMLRSLKAEVLYQVTGYMSLNYTMFLYEEGTRLLIAGPYLTEQPDAGFCEGVLLDNGFNLSLLTPFHQYCQRLPIVSGSRMQEAARVAIRAVAGYEGEIPYQHYRSLKPAQMENGQDWPAEVGRLDERDSAAMEYLERRYYYEKLMLQEVAQGSYEQAMKYYKLFTLDKHTIVRTEDPIRTSKNLGFSLNTMLRKSAEQAGIHPVHLDIISTNFAMLLENAESMEDLDEINFQMIGAYCRFVQTYRLDQFSPMIRKAVTYLRIHLADPLTLEQIASFIKVSPSYLSRTFNQEVGESISNYITRARVEKGAELLTFSRMSVQNIAAYVGFSDLNYFSRCFKKYMKMTPTAYRAASSVGA